MPHWQAIPCLFVFFPFLFMLLNLRDTFVVFHLSVWMETDMLENVQPWVHQYQDESVFWTLETLHNLLSVWQPQHGKLWITLLPSEKPLFHFRDQSQNT